MVGGAASATVTEKLHEASVAETVTLVVPTGKNVPEAGVPDTVPQLPEVVESNVTIAPRVGTPFTGCVSFALTNMLSGQVSVHAGGVGLEPVTLVSAVLLALRLSSVLLLTVAVLFRPVPSAIAPFTL